jgi:transposase
VTRSGLSEVSDTVRAVVLQRAVKVSLQWLGPKDRRRLAALLQAYRAAVNFFVRLLWREPSLGFTTPTSKRLVRTRLSGRYRDQALKQAWELVTATKKSAAALGVVAGRPFFRGMAILDAKFVDVEAVEGEHDLLVRLSSLKKGERLSLPTKGTRVLRKWLAKPGARLVQGAGLGDGDLLTLWVELPKPALRLEGPVLGVDVGVRHLLATSDGMFLGSDFRDVRDKVKRRKPGSKGRGRARRERDDLICAAVKRLPWREISAVAVEDLSGIKRGKKRGQGKRLRRALAAWRPPVVHQRLLALAAEHGVLAISVPGFWNSVTCPTCGHRSRANRSGPVFRCQDCGHLDDADHVGALAAKTRAEGVLGEAVEADREERATATAKRERRKAAAKQRGERTAEKRRQRAAAEAAQTIDAAGAAGRCGTESNDSSSRGAQSPAARTPRESAPVRDQASGGAPSENPEGGHSRGGRRKAAGRQGEQSPPTRGPKSPRGTTAKFSDHHGARDRVLALDEFPNKP